MTAVVTNPFPDGMLPVVWDYQHPATGETVRNVEALCRKHLNQLSAGLTSPLEHADYHEALGFLLGEVVVLAEQKYDPARATSLGDFLNWRLPRALIDHWRHDYGRNGERRIFDGRRLEQAARDGALGSGTGDSDFDDRDSGLRRPDQAAAQGSGDAAGAWTLPREWTDAEGGRGAARPAEGLGGRAGRGGAGGADRGGVGAGGRDGLPTARASAGASAFVDCDGCGWRHYPHAPHAPNGVTRWHYPAMCTSCGDRLAA